MPDIPPPSKKSEADRIIESTTKEIRNLEGAQQAPGTEDAQDASQITMGNIGLILYDLAMILNASQTNLAVTTLGGDKLIEGGMKGLVGLDSSFRTLFTDPTTANATAFVNSYDEVEAWASKSKSKNPAWKVIHTVCDQFGVGSTVQNKLFDQAQAYGEKALDGANYALNLMDPFIDSLPSQTPNTKFSTILSENSPSVAATMSLQIAKALNPFLSDPTAPGATTALGGYENALKDLGGLVSKGPTLLSSQLILRDRKEEGNISALIQAASSVMAIDAKTGQSNIANEPGSSGG